MTNKFNKIVSALVLCGVTTFASASDLQIDPTHSASGALTTIFGGITADEISPTSAYFDLDNNGINTGDIVFDSAFGEQFGSLNPTGNDLGLNLAPTGWTLFADYEFYGAAIVNDGSLDSDGDGFADADLDKSGSIGTLFNGVGTMTDLDVWQLSNTGNADGILDAGEELAAQFTGGYINVFLDAPYTAPESSGAFAGYDGTGGARDLSGTDSVLAMHFDVTGSALADVSIQVFSQLTMIIDDFLYSPAVGDIKDYIDLPQNNAFGTFLSELNGLSNEPTVDTGYVISDLQNAVLNAKQGTSGVAYTADDTLPNSLVVRTRTTDIASANLRIDVPEPGSIALFGLALVGFAGAARRKFS
jgi:hypothetical protein